MTIELRADKYITSRLETLKSECEELSKKAQPFLKVVLVGSNPASLTYVKNKKILCEKIGAKCEIVNLSSSISKEGFLKEIDSINSDPEVHGLIIQLPVPTQLKELDIYELVDSKKDVDGFSSKSVSHIYKNQVNDRSLVSCTPKGILNLLKAYDIEAKGKNVVIIGRSHIVGKPLFHLLNNEDATVTLCHSKTKNLNAICQRADILVSAIGAPKFIDTSFVKEEMIVVDVGISLDKNGKISGDVDYENVSKIVKAITPIPGGVGPMTVFSLVENLIIACRNQIYEN